MRGTWKGESKWNIAARWSRWRRNIKLPGAELHIYNLLPTTVYPEWSSIMKAPFPLKARMGVEFSAGRLPGL